MTQEERRAELELAESVDANSAILEQIGRLCDRIIKAEAEDLPQMGKDSFSFK